MADRRKALHDAWRTKKLAQGFVYPSNVSFDGRGRPTPADAKWHYMMKTWASLTDEEKSFWDNKGVEYES